MKFFKKPKRPAFLEDVYLIFGHRVRNFGNTPAGVLWKNEEGQQLRFEILAGILEGLPPSTPVSLCDFGCGYGALFDFLCTLPHLPDFTYTGYDISPDMIKAAKARINDPRARFIEATEVSTPVDFTLVSGTYNLKIDAPEDVWTAYIKDSLTNLWQMSRQGLAFNLLDNRYPEKGDGLYYADASEFRDFCSGFSSDITIIDNDPQHEWTMIVRRPPEGD